VQIQGKLKESLEPVGKSQKLGLSEENEATLFPIF
jgi:hypothetical protein